MEEDYAAEEGEEGEGEGVVYPVRASLSITKVSCCYKNKRFA